MDIASLTARYHELCHLISDGEYDFDAALEAGEMERAAEIDIEIEELEDELYDVHQTLSTCW